MVVRLLLLEQDITALNLQALDLLNLQSIHPRFVHQDDGYALLLTDQLIDSDVLSLLHDQLINKGQEIALIVAGLGNVGRVFIEQLSSQIERFQMTIRISL